MKIYARIIATTAAVLAISGCAHHVAQQQAATPAQEAALEQIKATYNAGQYAETAQQVGLSVDLQTAPRDMHIEALKLQAFSYCLLKDTQRCKRSFDRLVQRYPDFDLPAAEKQHPMWGPVFEQAKTQGKQS